MCYTFTDVVRCVVGFMCAYILEEDVMVTDRRHRKCASSVAEL